MSFANFADTFTSEEWVALSAIGQVVGALATLAAVVVSLWVVLKRPRCRVRALGPIYTVSSETKRIVPESCRYCFAFDNEEQRTVCVSHHWLRIAGRLAVHSMKPAPDESDMWEFLSLRETHLLPAEVQPGSGVSVTMSKRTMLLLVKGVLATSVPPSNSRWAEKQRYRLRIRWAVL